MADWIPFPSPEDMPDPSGMDRTALLTYLESLRERIAQLVVLPFLAVSFQVTDELDETERGAGGFGHTGRK